MRLPMARVGDKEVFDVEESARVIRRAHALGVNFFDTAPYYCGGQSEAILGEALKGIRDQVYVSTKNPIEDASGDHFRERLEKSLERLGLERVDFYHMWGISLEAYQARIAVKDGPLSAALKAREEGLIAHLSFSFHDKGENLPKLVDEGVFETVLCQYNILDRSNEAGIAYAKAKGLGVVVMGPVGGGRLGAPSEVIRSLLAGQARSNAEIALRFVLTNPGVACALSGMGSLAQVEENAATASNAAPLSAAELESIAASMEENKRLAELYCTGCKYCMPCPQGVNIPLCFQLMNYHRVYKITDYARGEYRSIGKVEWMPGKDASACTECGECETKCPQRLSVREQLKETHAALAAAE